MLKTILKICLPVFVLIGLTVFLMADTLDPDSWIYQRCTGENCSQEKENNIKKQKDTEYFIVKHWKTLNFGTSDKGSFVIWAGIDIIFVLICLFIPAKSRKRHVRIVFPLFFAAIIHFPASIYLALNGLPGGTIAILGNPVLGYMVSFLFISIPSFFLFGRS